MPQDGGPGGLRALLSVFANRSGSLMFSPSSGIIIEDLLVFWKTRKQKQDLIQLLQPDFGGSNRRGNLMDRYAQEL